METQLPAHKFGKDLMRYLHTDLGLVNTCLDKNDRIIANRARYYRLQGSKNTRLSNAPSVNNSYKWAGGGLLSTSGDLVRFGNIMLYSFKGVDPFGRPGFLPQSIVDQMWSPADNGKHDYGIGFAVLRDKKAKSAFTYEPRYTTLFSHTGGAVGATSVLLIEPESEVVVALIANLEAARGIQKIALDVADQFVQLESNQQQSL